MKKNIIIFIILLFILVGCTSPIEKDLIKYINNDIVKALEIEKEGAAEYEKFITMDNYSFDELLNIVNKNLIPIYKKLINELNNINPNTNKVQEIHNTYIEGAKKQLEALNKIKEGTETKNEEIIEEGNEILKEANDYLKKFKNEIFNLAEEYKIEYTK